MKLAAILALSASFIASTTFAEPASDRVEILIDLKDDTGDEDERAVELKLGGIDLRLNSIHSNDERFFVAEVERSAMAHLLEAVKGDPRIEHAEENFVYEISGQPNDPLYKKQWSFGMVDATRAWNHSTGKGVVVAVIDTGVAFEDHKQFRLVEDLRGAKFAAGYDFVRDTEHPNDEHGHGTHVAGTIAQVTNNGIGVAGLAHQATIMPLKVLDRSGRGTAADIADAIRFAADEGAQVINMSLGGGMRSLVMESAVAYARRKGLVVACAAGNNGRGVVEFPAAYPGAFAVSAVGPDGQLSFYSSWGKELAIAAPGGDKQKGGDDGAILQNTFEPNNPGRTNLYLAFQGTSMATPHVAGAAALVMGAGVTNADEVEKILKETASDKGPRGWDQKYGAGILNAGAAAEKAKKQSGGLVHLLAGVSALVLLGLSTARRTGFRLGIGAWLGVVFGSSGFFFLGSLGIVDLPVIGALLTSPLPTWDLAIFGASFHQTPIFASFLPVLALLTLFLGVSRLRGFLVGLALGVSAHLLVSAFLLPADVLWIPGTASWLDRAWLLVNAPIAAALGLLICRR